jgi:SAM-dependent methyltransferase
MICRSCNTKLKPFFSLGKMPLVNAFLKKADLKREKKYELATAFCPKCFLVQLTKTIPPEELFTEYLYFSSTSSSFLKHCEATAESLIKKLKLSKENLVLEIASNDGAQLQYFAKAGIPVLGVDPAKNIAQIANAKGIPTIPEFFTHAFAIHLKEREHVTADLVFGANVLAHVPNINNFLEGVRVILAPRGTAVFEFPYLKGLLENKFDTIYHEHVFYYSMLALRNVFERSGLRIYDFEHTPAQGGSLRIFASHPGIFPINVRVGELLNQEIKAGYGKLGTYAAMSRNVSKLKTNLLALLKRLKLEGKRIAAYSAPAKGNVMLNYFGIGKRHLDFIVDKAEAKQGLYTPGTQMEVLHPRVIAKNKPDYLLVLCWNIADEVVNQLSEYRKSGGKFIIPIPQIKII